MLWYKLLGFTEKRHNLRRLYAEIEICSNDIDGLLNPKGNLKMGGLGIGRGGATSEEISSGLKGMFQFQFQDFMSESLQSFNSIFKKVEKDDDGDAGVTSTESKDSKGDSTEDKLWECHSL